MPPKPPRIEPDKPLLARIIEEIDGRAESLKPAVDEYNRLRRISIKLQQVLSGESESDKR